MSIINKKKQLAIIKHKNVKKDSFNNKKNKILLLFSSTAAIMIILMYSAPVFAKSTSIHKNNRVVLSSLDSELLNSNSNTEWFKYKEIDETKNYVTISGVIPVIDDLYESEIDRALQNMLNEMIETEFNRIIENAGNKQLTITFSCDIKQYDRFVSILLRSISAGSSANDSVKSFNFDKDSNKLVTINDVLGINGIKLINHILSDETKNNIDKYNANFLGIEETHDFYVEDGKLYVVFDKYEIAPGYVGIIEFPILIDHITNVTVTSYYPKTNYKTKMVMLKQVTDAFGYSLTWTPETSTAVAVGEEGKVIISVSIGKNEYYKNGIAMSALEHYPEITDDRTYVPVAFFEDVMGLSYSIAKNGEIVISGYGDFSKPANDLTTNINTIE